MKSEEGEPFWLSSACLLLFCCCENTTSKFIQKNSELRAVLHDLVGPSFDHQGTP